jgi:Na+/proline symporter/signal transduction histidine kinase/ActR/RegA family two-component response regulator
MTTGWILISLALAYVGALFLLAWFADRVSQRTGANKPRPLLYACSIAVFCTSWTFFGSVGLAANTGYDFLPVYLGPVLAFVFGHRFIQHVVKVAKSQNLTSVADVLAARYGRSQTLAMTATLIAVVGTLPYIALQLKAVVLSIDLILGPQAAQILPAPLEGALVVALLLALFAVLFGTRHTDATEHQDGMMLAVAAESIVKLVAFLAVGIFVTLTVFSSPAGLYAGVRETPALAKLFAQGIHAPTWITVTALSFCAILLLPRQFHVTVVENKDPREIRTAAWLFPLYLIAINLFVLPIAAAGLLMLPKGTPADTFVLALPQALNAQTMTFVGFIGGLSAATAMVIVDSVALSIMVTNFFAPLLVKGPKAAEDVSQRLLLLRRFAIFVIILAGYGAYRLLISVQGLAGIGLVAFAAIAQLAPAFFGAFFWRNGTARGATAGMLVGFLVWLYTLIIPWFADAGLVSRTLMTEGPLGLWVLAPEHLFGLELDRLSHGVLCSLTANILTFVFVSLQRYPAAAVRQQAELFSFYRRRQPAAAPVPSTPRPGIAVTVGEVQTTVTRFLGIERGARSFREFETLYARQLDPAARADADLVRYSEYLLNSAVGAASARLIMTVLLRRDAVDAHEAVRLLDAVPEALQFNRDLLQSALDQVRDGIAVFDKDMRLTWWNARFREVLGLAPEYGQVGVPLQTVLQAIGQSKEATRQGLAEFVNDRFYRLTGSIEGYYEHVDGGQRILDIRSAPMPVGGFVITFADVTERKLSADALQAANADLEDRVAKRTNDLSVSNRQLSAEKARADAANQDKTRFLAAASHDVMQPLHAARLYATSLQDKLTETEHLRINKSFLSSLDAVDEILTALMDIAKIDSGRLDPELSSFALNDVFDQLRIEFTPIAESHNLKLTIVKTSLWVRTDRRLIRRVLQNLVSNAIKYSKNGGVVVGARRSGEGVPGTLGNVTLQVTDTGPGIPDSMREFIFREFTRLPDVDANVRGLGLGLSIVERVTRMLRHPVSLRSRVGKGSTFAVSLPRAAALTVAPTTSQPNAVAAAIPTLAQPRAASLRGTTILVIDNDPLVLDGMRTILSGWDCTVHTAIGIKAALAVLFDGKVQPDVLLVDFHLGDGTGLDAISSVRVRLGVQTPAILITADTSPDLAREARLYGASHLKKPIRPAQLRAAITHFARQRLAAE